MGQNQMQASPKSVRSAPILLACSLPAVGARVVAGRGSGTAQGRNSELWREMQPTKVASAHCNWATQRRKKQTKQKNAATHQAQRAHAPRSMLLQSWPGALPRTLLLLCAQRSRLLATRLSQIKRETRDSKFGNPWLFSKRNTKIALFS